MFENTQNHIADPAVGNCLTQAPNIVHIFSARRLLFTS